MQNTKESLKNLIDKGLLKVELIRKNTQKEDEQT